MTIRFQADINDFLAFSEHFIRTDKRVKKDKGIMLTLLPLMLAVMFVIAYFEGPIVINNWLNFTGVCVAVCGSWFVFASWNYRRIHMKKVKRRLNESHLYSEPVEMEMYFDDECLRITTSIGDIYESRLDAMLKVNETAGYFFVYRTAFQAIPIPKAKITQEEVGNVRRFLEEHIANYHRYK